MDMFVSQHDWRRPINPNSMAKVTCIILKGGFYVNMVYMVGEHVFLHDLRHNAAEFNNE